MSERKEIYKNLTNKFRHLWTKAINTKDYDKQEWIEMESLIKNLEETKKKKS